MDTPSRSPSGSNGIALSCDGAPALSRVRPDSEHRFSASRGEHDELRVQLREYKGAPFVDLRVWSQGSDGAWHPTRRDVTVRLRELGAVIRTLDAIAHASGSDSESSGGAR